MLYKFAIMFLLKLGSSSEAECKVQKTRKERKYHLLKNPAEICSWASVFMTAPSFINQYINKLSGSSSKMPQK